MRASGHVGIPSVVHGRVHGRRDHGRCRAHPQSPRFPAAAGTVRGRPCPDLRLHAVTAGDQQVADYNKQMQQRMNWDGSNPYEYHPERGIYFHEVFPRVICGSQPRTAEDISLLHDQAEVGVIVSLQQDKDLEHWGVSFGDLQHRAQQLGITYQRCPAVDFDPHSLRNVLPHAAYLIQAALQQQPGRVYVHCTAGLGRAPAACIAHRFWFSQQQLEEAYSSLTETRPCGPKREAIRGATYDLLDDRGFDTFGHLPEVSYSVLSPEQKAHIQRRLS